MLSEYQIKSLPKGVYTNSALRKEFKHHGTVVPARVTIEGNEIDTKFVGNRFQARFRRRNPFAPLPEREKPLYQSNRIEVAKKMSLFKKALNFLRKLFGYANLQAAQAV